MLNNIKTKILYVFFLFLALYFIFNLLGGERGLFSYFDKKNILNKLIIKKNTLEKEIAQLETSNSLLSDNLDKDYIEILLRDKFLLGKKNETVYILKNEKN
tara:strand:+ start:270 stop:572 length:303 start_codon:yes stop_codon:yes gene_type:complete